MKVLHVIPRLIGGGPERHLLALATAWHEGGLETQHQIAVLDAPASARLLIAARRLGVAIVVKPSDDVLDAAVAAADVVHVTYWNHPRLLDVLRRELPPARVLVRSAVAGFTPPQVLGAEVGRFADAMILPCPASWGTPAAREALDSGRLVEFIPGLADMSRLEGFAPRAHEGIRVGYLGLVEPTKMHPRFAEMTAAVRSPVVSFDVFGGGSGIPGLQRRLEELGTGERVRFHGHVDDLRAAFSAIDVFGYPLAPDTSAASEKALQEAMWVGIPPVVMAGIGASGLVEHDRTGLVCETEDEYSRAIERLASDSGLRRRLGEAARDFARREFDPKRNSARSRAAFDQVAALPRRSRDPLPGRGVSAAGRFVLSLGELGGAFAASLAGGPQLPVPADADALIARSSPVLATGEGGVIHYRNAFPDDGFLRLWSGLIAAHAGDIVMATREFEAAEAIGVPPERVRPLLR